MIKIENLVKQYGDKYAVNDISFSVGDGEIVGFLGPNGAGKSTTMNMLTGYLSSTSGTVSIDGFDILENTMEAKKLIGYLPEQPPLYMDMTVIEYLNFVYELKKCTFNRQKHLDEICEVVKLSDVKNRIIGHLSKGYKQRVGIAQAIVGNPKVIILDEPTEVQATCDRVIIINKGRIVADERTEDLANVVGGKRRLSVKICGNQKEILSAISKLNGVTYVESLAEHELDSTTFLVESEAGIDIRKPLFNLLSERHWPILGMEALGMNLEDIFISLVDLSENAPKAKKKRIKINTQKQTDSGVNA